MKLEAVKSDAHKRMQKSAHRHQRIGDKPRRLYVRVKIKAIYRDVCVAKARHHPSNSWHGGK